MKKRFRLLGSLSAQLRNPEFLALQGPQWAAVVASATIYMCMVLALTDEERGWVAFGLDISYIAVNVLAFGRGRALLLYSRDEPTPQAKRITLFLSRGFVSGLVASASMLGFAIVLDLEPLLIIGVALSIGSGLLVALGHLTHSATSRPTQRPIRNYLFQVLIVLQILVLVFFGNSNPVMWLAAYTIASLVFISFSAGKPFSLRRPNAGSDPDYFLIRARGARLFPFEILNLLASRSPRLLVFMFLGVSDLGTYVVLIIFFELLTPVLRSWLDVTHRKWLGNHPQRMLSAGLLVLRKTAIVSGFSHFLAVLLTFGFLAMLRHPQTSESVLLISVLSLAYFLNSISTVLDYLLIAKSDFTSVIVSKVLFLTSLTLLALALVQTVNLLGAALAFFLTAVVVTLFQLSRWQKKF